MITLHASSPSVLSLVLSADVVVAPATSQINRVGVFNGGGLFGRHAADVMRWLGGRGVGVDNHSPWSYAGADKECLHGRYGVGVGNRSPYIFYGQRSEGPITMVVVLYTARQAASVAAGRMKIRELAVYPAVADGRNVGGFRKAHSVST